MLRRLGQLLLLSVATLAGCNFDAVPIGAPSDDAAIRPPTEDESLEEFGRQLAGTWRGLATMEAFFLEPREAFFQLEWTPDADPVRSGKLSIRCVPGTANCTPASGPGASLEFRYSLYEMTDQGNVKGALELLEDGVVTAFGTLDLTLSGSGSELSFSATGPPPFSFASLKGTRFIKDPPAFAPDAGASFPGPNP